MVQQTLPAMVKVALCIPWNEGPRCVQKRELHVQPERSLQQCPKRKISKLCWGS